VREEELSNSCPSIIALDIPDGAAKLCEHKGKDVGEGGEGVELLA
jgi:hypothetical protein